MLYNVLYWQQMPSTTDKLAEMKGLPTQQDKERIQRILLRYEKKYPGRILHTVREAQSEHRAEGNETAKAKYGVVNQQAHGRVLFELPEDLGNQIIEVAPFVFKNKKHLAWFAKNFKELLIPAKY